MRPKSGRDAETTDIKLPPPANLRLPTPPARGPTSLEHNLIHPAAPRVKRMNARYLPLLRQITSRFFCRAASGTDISVGTNNQHATRRGYHVTQPAPRRTSRSACGGSRRHARPFTVMHVVPDERTRLICRPGLKDKSAAKGKLRKTLPLVRERTRACPGLPPEVDPQRSHWPSGDIRVIRRVFSTIIIHVERGRNTGLIHRYQAIQHTRSSPSGTSLGPLRTKAEKK
jgi:hypothetical protein